MIIIIDIKYLECNFHALTNWIQYDCSVFLMYIITLCFSNFSNFRLKLDFAHSIYLI